MKAKIYKPCPKCGTLHLTTDEECPHCANRAVENEVEITEKTAVEELQENVATESVQEEATTEVVVNEDTEETQKESIAPIVTEVKLPKEPKNNGKKGFYAIIAILVVVIVSLLVVIMQKRNPAIEVNDTTLQGNTSLAILTQEIETTTGIAADTLTESTNGTPAVISTTKKASSSKKETTTQKRVETTTQKATEPVTAARPNVKVVVNKNKIYDSLNGTAELVDYQVSEVPNSMGIMLQVRIKVIDKKASCGDAFCVPCAAYDANGSLLYSNYAYVTGWKLAEIGDILKGKFQTYYMHGDVALIEIG